MGRDEMDAAWKDRGPQVTARVGTKRWHAQVVKRLGFLNIYLSHERAKARREAEEREADQLFLLLTETAGHA